MIQAAGVVGDSVQKLRLLGFRSICVGSLCSEIISRYETATLACSEVLHKVSRVSAPNKAHVPYQYQVKGKRKVRSQYFWRQ
jgi:hypothetical protein